MKNFIIVEAKNMTKSAYIISKPLQYINASNIEDENEKDCILVNYFNDVQGFKKRIEELSNYWSNVYLVDNTYSAIIFVLRNKNKYNKLFIDSDYGIFLYFLLYFLNGIAIFTYEEGYASYNYIRKPDSILSKFKILISKIFGIKNYVGGHPLTKGMYLYNKEKFEGNIKTSKEVLSFRNPFFKHVFKLKEINLNIFDRSYIGESVLLYLPNYFFNTKVKDYLEKFKGFYTMVKPHPYMNTEKVEELHLFEKIIQTNTAAEIVLVKLVRECGRLVIIHEGSFAIEYIKFQDNCTLIDLR